MTVLSVMRALALGSGLQAYCFAAVYVSGILEGDWRLLRAGDQVSRHSSILNFNMLGKKVFHSIKTLTTAMRSTKQDMKMRKNECRASHCGPPQSAWKERRTQDRPLCFRSPFYMTISWFHGGHFRSHLVGMLLWRMFVFLRCSCGKKIYCSAADFWYWFRFYR